MHVLQRWKCRSDAIEQKYISPDLTFQEYFIYPPPPSLSIALTVGIILNFQCMGIDCFHFIQVYMDLGRGEIKASYHTSPSYQMKSNKMYSACVEIYFYWTGDRWAPSKVYFTIFFARVARVLFTFSIRCTIRTVVPQNIIGVVRKPTQIRIENTWSWFVNQYSWCESIALYAVCKCVIDAIHP